MNLYREVAESVAEIVNVELKHGIVARPCGHLVVIGQMIVDLPDIVLFWEGVADALHQFPLVVVVEE